MLDKELQDNVMRELDWDPQVDSAHIGVTVKDGAVTLMGQAPSYPAKYSAVDAVERLNGVRAVDDRIEVQLTEDDLQDDERISQEIARAFRLNLVVPETSKHWCATVS